MTLAQFVPFLPEIFLATAGFAVLLLGIPLGRGGVRPLSLFGVVSLGITGVLVWLVARPIDGATVILGDMLVIDQFAVFFKLLILAAGMVAIFMSAGYLERFGYGGGEYVSLILFATVGMFIMASGANLASLYVGLELMALSVYVLVGYFKLEIKSNEGAIKYFVLGAASSAILLYGIGRVLFGSTDSFGGASSSFGHLPEFFDRQFQNVEWIGPAYSVACDPLYARLTELERG